jgi:phosphoglycolate phosphatase-like HAD superfamily hydrolase
MPFDAVIFDFDGTLVDSVSEKYQTFFALFPDTPDHRAVVAAVLNADPEGSRHHVIPRMIEGMRGRGLSPGRHHTAESAIDAYSQGSLAAVAACREIPGATQVLEAISRVSKIYVFSNTPEHALVSLVGARGWSHLFSGISGFPKEKTAVVRSIIAGQPTTPPARIAVVGDDASDEVAARANGCAFFRVAPPYDLAGIARALGVLGV